MTMPGKTEEEKEEEAIAISCLFNELSHFDVDVNVKEIVKKNLSDEQIGLIHKHLEGIQLNLDGHHLLLSQFGRCLRLNDFRTIRSKLSDKEIGLIHEHFIAIHSIIFHYDPLTQ